MGWRDWVRTVEIEPSLYAADFANLGEQVVYLLNTGARVFHWDVGDGHFVEPITMGPVVLRSISGEIHQRGGVVDVHLMVEEPEKHIPQFAEAGADSVTFHVEVAEDPSAVAAVAREHGLQVGVACSPGTPVEQLVEAAAHADIALVMSVVPGYSGQEFLEGSLERLREARAALPEEVYLQVDGGITNENVRAAYDAGAALIVAASAIFSREDLPRAYRRLVHELA